MNNSQKKRKTGGKLKMKKDIRAYGYEELQKEMATIGEKAFRAKQIYEWLHVKLVDHFDEMTNLSKVLREKLEENYEILPVVMLERQISQIDGTNKFLFRLYDGNVVESVLMKYKHGNSVCISSQVGCRMGCAFCASTIGGLVRNLSPSEMLGQIYQIQKISGERVSNVVAYAIDKVKRGLTPNPDVMCNKLIKFGCFEQEAGHLYDKTATGHYASILEKDGKIWLGTAQDPVKDQTDFLAQIDYLQISKLMFPLGGLMKNEVRDIARIAKLPSAQRKDSQGICFLGKINYNEFLRRFLGEKEGDIIEMETGKRIGTHKGYWFHTIDGVCHYIIPVLSVQVNDIQAQTVFAGGGGT